MKTVLPMIILSCAFWPLQCMDNGGSQRLYPLVPVLQSGRANTDEQALLLTHDFLDKDRQTFGLPSYQELYIAKAKSERKLQKLQTKLKEKERELAALPNKLDGKIRALARERAQENIKSNLTVSSLAFTYYFFNMWLTMAGDPRATIGGWNGSALPCINNIFGWVGSLGFFGISNHRNPDNYEN